MTDLAPHVERHIESAIANLATLVAFPSIAADQTTKMDDCVAFLEAQLADLGGAVQVLRLPGARPLVFAEIPGRSPRSLLFYQHYDVQPTGPRDLWQSEPFTLTERDGYMYARGIADNKGNLAARLAALRVLLDAEGELPLTVRFLIEGEEEIGSPHLIAYLEQYDHLLRADGCLWEGGYRDPNGRLTLSLGIKGICKLHLRVHGPERDLHGKYAPLAKNPALRLAAALSVLADSDGTVLAPGYYNPVRKPNEQERIWLDDAAGDVDTMQREIGLGPMPVNDGRAALERLLYFSGCNVAGFVAGGVGSEGRNIVPAKAEAALEFRLVPDQEPESVYGQLTSHLVVNGFDDIEVSYVHGVLPARTAPDHPLVPAALGAIEAIYGQPPVVHPNSPGTGPMSNVCHSRGMAAVAMGVGHPASNTHAPNENIGINDYRLGIEVVAELLRRFAEI